MRNLVFDDDNMTEVQPTQANGIAKGVTINSKELEEGLYYAPSSENELSGPNQVLPADSCVSTERNGRVKITLTKGEEHWAPIMSIPGSMSQMANSYPDRMALIARPDTKQKKSYTFREYEQEVRTVAKAFLKLGLERYHGVAIIGFNTPEWFVSDLAAIYAGGFAVGVYTTNTPEACQHCIENSQSNIVVVEDDKQLEKILKIKDNLPFLKAIVMYDDVPKEKGVLSWKDLLEIGQKESDDKLNEVLKTIAANECCTLIYTSGTVGKPKAVMLSHDNLLQDARSILRFTKFSIDDKHVLISYLPLSHVAAQILDIYCTMLLGGTVYFAAKDALKGSLLNTLLLARPTIVLGVPRVWEKIYSKMQEVARSNGFVKTLIGSWAKSQALYYNTNKLQGNDTKNWGYVFARWLVLSKVRAALGLDRCQVCFTAAAPLSREIKQYFMSLDILILEAYGMSECSGGHALNLNECYKLDGVGVTLPGFHTRLDKPDSSGEGEICMRGRHVFMGYLNEPEKTREVIDEGGWLHSGDLGKIDSDAFLYVTGRIKELIITAGGENIPPVPIEHSVLSELPALSNAILIGDKRKYLTMLVTLKTDMDINTGEPKDTFTPDTLKWLKSIGSTAKTVTDVLNTRDPLVYNAIDAAIKAANTKALSNAQKVQKFKILPHDLSIPTGELGPTYKIRRNIIYKKYEKLIEEMYN
nr:PREDICTED: very long-chain-fatty-acid--CoA ligase bubblegum isoform X2 [Megachile rotundata]